MSTPRPFAWYSRFLQQVRSDGGAAYGETAPGKEPAATAMGLLCRQYLKVKRTDPAYLRGIEYLGGLGPSKTDLAFDYFATQVLYKYYGYEWDVWNRANRKLLISSQVREGAEAGSWWLPNEVHAAGGGRLYQTAMAAFMLDLGLAAPCPLSCVETNRNRSTGKRAPLLTMCRPELQPGETVTIMPR